jgi:hypothetical protein
MASRKMMKLVSILLLTLGAISVVYAFLVFAVAGICENECTSPTGRGLTFIAIGVVLWVLGVVVFLRDGRGTPRGRS